MNRLRQQIIEKELVWLGTPYQKNQACKQVGTDCIGFHVCIFNEVFGWDYVYPSSSCDIGVYVYSWMQQCGALREVENAEVLPCDLLLFSLDYRTVHHVAMLIMDYSVLCDSLIIQALPKVGVHRARLSSIQSRWQKTFRLRALEALC